MDIYISHSLVSSKHLNSFIHGIELKSYEFILYKSKKQIK